MNKDVEKIFESLRINWIIDYIWSFEDIKDLTHAAFLKHKHLGPDLILYSDNIIYWIEHFYIDSAMIIKKKWSVLKKEYLELWGLGVRR